MTERDYPVKEEVRAVKCPDFARSFVGGVRFFRPREEEFCGSPSNAVTYALRLVARNEELKSAEEFCAIFRLLVGDELIDGLVCGNVSAFEFDGGEGDSVDA